MKTTLLVFWWWWWRVYGNVSLPSSICVQLAWHFLNSKTLVWDSHHLHTHQTPGAPHESIRIHYSSPHIFQVFNLSVVSLMSQAFFQLLHDTIRNTFHFIFQSGRLGISIFLGEFQSQNRLSMSVSHSRCCSSSLPACFKVIFWFELICKCKKILFHF